MNKDKLAVPYIPSEPVKHSRYNVAITCGFVVPYTEDDREESEAIAEAMNMVFDQHQAIIEFQHYNPEKVSKRNPDGLIDGHTIVSINHDTPDEKVIEFITRTYGELGYVHFKVTKMYRIEWNNFWKV